ncbi:CopG family transcriptional regulator [Alcaligenaceae bacterium]|nr:CopG family transcriptional regulator [Alcaligenaceae bacterium]
MKSLIIAAALMGASSMAYAAKPEVTVYQDPNCGCCTGWAEHMLESGFDVRQIKTSNMGAIKDKLGVPRGMESCHTAVVDATGQVIEGHVPANAVQKMLAQPDVKGLTAPGMPVNSPGMGKMDGNLVTLDFAGKEFSRD